MDEPISSLIASAERGDRGAADALFAALYSDLHRLTRRQLARSGGGVTLGATTLLHEAYLDISQRDAAVFPDRGPQGHRLTAPTSTSGTTTGRCGRSS